MENFITSSKSKKKKVNDIKQNLISLQNEFFFNREKKNVNKIHNKKESSNESIGSVKTGLGENKENLDKVTKRTQVGVEEREAI